MVVGLRYVTEGQPRAHIVHQEPVPKPLMVRGAAPAPAPESPMLCTCMPPRPAAGSAGQHVGFSAVGLVLVLPRHIEEAQIAGLECTYMTA